MIDRARILQTLALGGPLAVATGYPLHLVVDVIVTTLVFVVLAATMSIILAVRDVAGRARRRRARFDQLALWRTGVAVMGRVDRQLGEFEMPDTVDGILDSLFGRPLLGDNREPDTARFYAAYRAAHALWSDTAPTDTTAIQAFVDAARDAEQMWRRADDNARDKAQKGTVGEGHHLSHAEYRALRGARAMLALALDPDTEPAEAHLAERKARAILEELVQIPGRLDLHLTEAITAAHLHVPHVPKPSAAEGDRP
ncbi:hypothetical protein [Nocardia sp. NPDC051570]|uniref:hypothetical protein n=1 Tax=Nocardia sp. NPDC051570 TaxID=3364324 RepID=UPI0037A3F086